MATIRNYCTSCLDEWTFESLHATLDTLDKENLARYGTLVSICEDCNNGICESIEMEEN